MTPLPDPVTASDGLVRRITIMARFIAERHRREFEVYWRENSGSKADPGETMAFFAADGLEQKIVLQRKVYL